MNQKLVDQFFGFKIERSFFLRANGGPVLQPAERPMAPDYGAVSRIRMLTASNTGVTELSGETAFWSTMP